MNDTFTFIAVVLAIWGILEIILFFKVWMMTDNVEKLKNKFVEGTDNSECKPFVNILSSVKEQQHYLADSRKCLLCFHLPKAVLITC